MDSPRTVLVIGAGPAGLTAALELLRQADDVRPIVVEQDRELGGLARTVSHAGNRIDIGGHRFFSKSDRVMRWWLDVLPLQALPEGAARITYQQSSRDVAGDAAGPDPEREDRVMLLRSRRSRIYYLRQFFDYPIRLDLATLRKLGPGRTVRIAASYLRSALFPIREPKNLEEFFVNRFGRELYRTFFKDYTEKVWGVSCREIDAAWGAQRIKGLSITRAVLHFLRNLLPGRRDLAQKDTETSLIEQFLYPKHGPGQLWEEVGRRIEAAGGTIRTRTRVERLLVDDGRLTGVEVRDLESGATETVAADAVFSTMPVRDLVHGLSCDVPEAVREVADGLVYRDFLTVGLLVDRLRVTEPDGGPIRDNWIYVQEPDVKVGRLQVFNNWSPWMVADPATVWLGLEYFCDEGDPLWSMDDAALRALGAEELDRIGILDRAAVRDGVVLRVPKTYPAYFGTYDRFGELQAFLDGFPNLYLVGRNGMHRYNNQDHSMLAAMAAVEIYLAGGGDKSAIWEVNTEEEYHEERAADDG